MIIGIILIGGLYTLVIASFFYGWERLKPFTSVSNQWTVKVSIIIPMRNEANHISTLLNDLSLQSYPNKLIEIILVDDHSTDDSVALARKFRQIDLQVLSLQDIFTGKKAALRTGIAAATGELILTTDADCRIGSNWISAMVSFYKQFKPVMILGPVLPLTRKTSSLPQKWVEEMGLLEFFSLQGSTAGAVSIGHPIMGNGANLAFPKSVFPEIEHIYHQNIASGDDIFALLTLKKKYPGRIGYLKSMEAAVYTVLPNSLKSFFDQRGRWTEKSKFYKDAAILVTAGVVFLTNASLLLSMVLGIVLGNFFPFLILLGIKTLTDLPFLWRVTSFFKERQLMVWFPLAQCFYFFYVCITVVWAVMMPIVWKERTINAKTSRIQESCHL